MSSSGDPVLRSWSYADLRAEGMTRSGIQRALDGGVLVRARRDVYVSGGSPAPVRAAATVGGRLDCVSLMHLAGVFVLDDDGPLHVQIPKHRSRLRAPHGRSTRLDGVAHRVVTHWRDDDMPSDALVADFPRALAQAVLCQTPRAAVATLDSALHHGAIAPGQLEDVFDALPRRLSSLRQLIDSRAESGPETFARLIARTFGVSVEPQVEFPGIGRVDLLIDGWIVVECDSRRFHGGWEQQERDRLRDLALGALGCASLRPTAAQLFRAPDLLRRAIAGLLARGRGA